MNKIKQLSIAEQKEQINVTKQVWNNENDKLILSLHDSFQVIDLNELMFCETDKGYTTFYCNNGKKYVVSKTLKEFEERLSHVDVTDDVEALTSGEELTEEFKEKASVIFEAAVKSKLREEVQRIEEEKELDAE